MDNLNDTVKYVFNSLFHALNNNIHTMKINAITDGGWQIEGHLGAKGKIFIEIGSASAEKG